MDPDAQQLPFPITKLVQTSEHYEPEELKEESKSQRRYSEELTNSEEMQAASNQGQPSNFRELSAISDHFSERHLAS